MEERVGDEDLRQRRGDPGWRPSKLQRERARTVPPEYPDDVMPRFGGHSSLLPGDDGGLVRGFSHLVIEVTNLDRSEAWYRDVVGLDVVGRNLTNEERPHSVLQLNSGQLWILVESPTVVTTRRSGMHHAFMLTPNQYRRLMRRVLDAGYELVDTRAQFRARGEYSISIRDPDGHGVQIQCNSPEAWELLTPGVGVVDCGPADQYKLGDVKLFKEADFFLVRLKEGFLAMTRWCTHLNGRTVYQKAHWRFYCPYHQSTFDRRGDHTGGEPGLKALRLNPVSFSAEGHVLVDTDVVRERDCFEPAQAAEPPNPSANGERTNGRH